MSHHVHARAVPAGDHPCWSDRGARLAAEVGHDGATTHELTRREMRTSRPHTLRVNTLAWLENNGHITYHFDTGRWRLTSSGRRLAQKAA